MPPLKIYFDKQWINEESNVMWMLAPFLGFKDVSSTDPDHGRFDEYLKIGADLFLPVTDINDCEIAVYPHGYYNNAENIDQIREIAEAMNRQNKKLLLFYNADDDSEIEISNVLVFRTSFYKSKQKPYEFALPGWSKDFVAYFPNGIFEIIEPQELPSVSYCGYIDNVKKGT